MLAAVVQDVAHRHAAGVVELLDLVAVEVLDHSAPSASRMVTALTDASRSMRTSDPSATSHCGIGQAELRNAQ
jgi:hypothetical protein